MNSKKLGFKEKVSYGLGAVGKDMVYMLSASYVLYYFQDTLGVSAAAMAVILLVARIFDAFNDPIMGLIVAKTKTRLGKFRPWLLIGTATNAVVLFLMFSAPPALDGAGLVAYAAVTYILWGITYTMMDIPYWSMIPAFTESGKEREGLTTLARSCAGIGSAIITVITMISVKALGKLFAGSNVLAKEIEVTGFRYFSAIIAILFLVFIILTVINIKEDSTADMKTASVKEMFQALLKNDQAIAVVVAIVLINTSIYLTSNLVIYFFKYDFGGGTWHNSYTLFSTFGGGIQILSIILLYPFLRYVLKFSNIKIFHTAMTGGIIGYITLLILSFTKMTNVYLLFIPGFFIFATNGVLSTLTTVFLANTCDYGLYKNGRSDESVIFSLQTFVVKLASGVSAFIAGIALQIFNLKGDEAQDVLEGFDYSTVVDQSSKVSLRMTMTIIPIIGLIVAIFWFKKKYILTEEKLTEISEKNNQMM